MRRELQLTVDRAEHRLAVDPARSLLSVLREELDLSGPKDGCGEGACGACTVLLDGRPVRSCVLPVAEADGRQVTTSAGLATSPAPGPPPGPLSDGLHPLERAFIEEAAFQCGYCAPGMAVAAAALLADDPHPDEASIRRAMDSNLCRCGMYPRIVRAVLRAASAGVSGAAGSTARPEPILDRLDAGVELAGSPARGTPPWDLAAPGERDFFSLLGDGVAAVVDPPPEDPSGQGFGLRPAGAWVHVGADGRVTAFTGKVDVGQGTRAALAQLAAWELEIRPETVGLVMGDTDLCPYDAGTFGSRSMPDAGPAMRAAAAAARRALCRLASERWEVGVDDLEVADGQVRTRDGARAAAYTELVAGRRSVDASLRGAEDSTRPTLSTRSRPSGPPAPPRGLVAAIRGQRRYVSDLRRPGMLHGRVLHEPAVGATPRSLDVAAALERPGFVLVGDDGFVGVAADDPRRATDLLAAIEVDWDLAPQPSDDGLE
ncbi:MAG: molybdopterin cofactor-binding domain-containing protein, partial [Candidatus Limnocylindrales bacterium]